ncbi:MAG: XRE family transcriptional regulator [Deltaproteobacteria bacterium]|nr:MAG: XRE family transcriptional regulator [Deltaproteobacteria bacterium]
MEIKERRKAIGWNRRELADRAGVNSAALALVERGEWNDEDLLSRLDRVLTAAEAGDFSLRIPPHQAPSTPPDEV